MQSNPEKSDARLGIVFHDKISSSQKIFVFWIFFLVLPIFAPWVHIEPGSGLDASWVRGISAAIERKMAFGSEIIFTYGPLANISIKTHSETFDFLTLLIGTCLSICLTFWIAKIYQRFERITFAVLMPLVLLTAASFAPEVVFLSMPLIAIQALYASDVRDKHGMAAILLSIALGTVPLILIKASYLVPVIFALMLVLMHLIAIRMYKEAGIFILFSTGLLILVWVAFFQDPRKLPDFIMSSFALIDGYSQAMSSAGPIGHVLAYLVFVAALLLALVKSLKRDKWDRIKIGMLAYGLFFAFVAFKSGFVRHDGHALAAGFGLMIFALMSLNYLNQKLQLLVLLPGFVASTYINNSYLPSPAVDLVQKVAIRVFEPIQGLVNRVVINTLAIKDESQTENQFLDDALFSKSPGLTRDTYSYRQDGIDTTSNRWTPRPVFQSYSAYNKTLQLANLSHLRSKNAADTILYRSETIDNRYPTIDDGQSLLYLLGHYKWKPIEGSSDAAILEKTMEPVDLFCEGLLIRKITANQALSIPKHSGVLFAKIVFSETPIGFASDKLWKTAAVEMKLSLSDGKVLFKRVVPNMVASGFLLSPYVYDARDLIRISELRPDLNPQEVNELEIVFNSSNLREWKNELRLEIQECMPRAGD